MYVFDNLSRILSIGVLLSIFVHKFLSLFLENQKNLLSDSWRVNQLDRATSAKGHAYNKFGTGKDRWVFTNRT